MIRTSSIRFSAFQTISTLFALIALLVSCAAEDNAPIESTAKINVTESITSESNSVVSSLEEPTTSQLEITSSSTTSPTPQPLETLDTEQTINPTPTHSKSDSESVNTEVATVHEGHELFMQQGDSYARFNFDQSQSYDFGSDQVHPLRPLHYAGETLFDNPGPGDALYSSFANHSDQLAYVTRTGELNQLWVSDLDLEYPQLVYTISEDFFTAEDSNRLYFDIVWSPDDQHIILDVYDPEQIDITYHIQTATGQDWPWECDRIALSPQTERLAIWCSSKNNSTEFAVIEWGGDIWISPEPPVTELVKQDIGLHDYHGSIHPKIWAWSDDGDMVAYFNPTDVNGTLLVADLRGNVQLAFPNAVWWQTDTVNESYTYLPDELIRWSEDGSTLLVFANELVENACPIYDDPYAPPGTVGMKVSCWQTIDVESGEVIWIWNTFYEELGDPNKNTWQVWSAAISSDGQKLAFYIKPVGRGQLALADLENGYTEIWSSLGGRTMKWKNTQSSE